MRAVAFLLLTYAAFDLPAWLLDRAGVALLGAAIAALTIGRYAPKPRAARFAVPKPPAILDENGRVDMSTLEPIPPELAARLAGHDRDGGTLEP